MAKLITPDGKTTEVKPSGEKFSLEELQQHVGGLIEKCRTKDKVFILDEEGLLKKLPDNLEATKELQRCFDQQVVVLVGNVLVCDTNEVH